MSNIRGWMAWRLAKSNLHSNISRPKVLPRPAELLSVPTSLSPLVRALQERVSQRHQTSQHHSGHWF